VAQPGSRRPRRVLQGFAGGGGGTFDYFHINSIEVDHDSNLLVSARNTFTVYKIDRSSSELIWRLGGKKSNFEMGAGTRTRYQHDARRHSDGAISIFDNGGVYKDDTQLGGLSEFPDNLSRCFGE
jgi:arylsulfotransferase ASST